MDKQPETDARRALLLKIGKWVAIGVAVLIGLKLVWMLVSWLIALVVGLISWLFSLLLSVVGFIVFCWAMGTFVFSDRARAKSRARNAEWERKTRARFGIDDQRTTYRQPPQTYNKRVYDEKDGVYRDVSVDQSGHATDSWGRSGRVDGDRYKH